MGQTFLDDRQVVNRAALPILGAKTNTQLSVIMPEINSEMDVPLRLSATFPTPDANLHIRASVTTTADGAQKSMPPLANSIISWPDSTINFQLGTTTGGTFSPNSGAGTITLPTSTVGFYIRAGFTLTSTGEVVVTFTAQSATLVGLADPGTLFTVSGLPLGWVDLQATAATAYKTANSSTNIIENAPGGVPAIHRFEIAANSPPVITGKAYPNIFLSPAGAGDVTTFAAALSALPSQGGVILLMDAISVNTIVTLPHNVTVLGRARNAIITFGTSGGFEVSGNECTLQDLVMLGTSGATNPIVDISGNDCLVRRCTLINPSGGSVICVNLIGNDNEILENTFNGVLFPSLGTGIVFNLGATDNTERDNLFTV